MQIIFYNTNHILKVMLIFQIAPLLPELRRLELVGNFDVDSNNISKLFPLLEYFSFQKQDLVTGLIQRARVFSQFVPDYLQEANVSPVAAAC